MRQLKYIFSHCTTTCTQNITYSLDNWISNMINWDIWICNIISWKKFSKKFKLIKIRHITIINETYISIGSKFMTLISSTNLKNTVLEVQKIFQAYRLNLWGNYVQLKYWDNWNICFSIVHKTFWTVETIEYLVG